MRILADENFPGFVVESLKKEGHDVFWSRVDSPGAKDRDLISRAREEGRILLTFDKDFGELAFRFGLSTSKGIILFRITASSPEWVYGRTLTALHQKISWAGHFAVVEDDRVRLTPLPKMGLNAGKKPGPPPSAREPQAAYGAGPRKGKRAGPKRKKAKKKK